MRPRTSRPSSIVLCAVGDPAADTFDVLSVERIRGRHRIATRGRMAAHLVEQQARSGISRYHPYQATAVAQDPARWHTDQVRVGVIARRHVEIALVAAVTRGRG